MKKRLLGMIAALFVFAVLLPATARATNTNPVNVYAILYADGEFVFQNGNTPESGRTVTKMYPVDLNALYTYESRAPWYNEGKSVRIANFKDKISPTSTTYWFNECTNLERVDNISNLDTANVISMRSMFSGCSGLTTLDVSHFNTANVTNMQSMFYDCSSLTVLDVSHFDTANVTNMYAMFFGCSGLTTLDVSHFDTANVTTMRIMFFGCSGLTALDVSHFDTANVTTMYAMFYNCNGLTVLNVSHFDTANVTDMNWMFSDCSGLTTLDLSRFDTSNVTNIYWMFSNCSNLKTIYASDKFTTASVKEIDESTGSRNMFLGCTALVGGAGTKYNSDYTDKTYARIDTASAPGYFTAKEDISSPVTQSFDVTRDAYAFGNSMSDFGYTSRGGKDGGAYPIPARSFFAVFGDGVRGKMMYKSKTSAPWAGNCAGMSASAALLFAYGRLNPSDFGKTDAWSLAIGDENAEMSVLTLVEVMQVAQYTDAFGRARQEHQILSGQSLNGLYQAVKDGAEQGRPTLLAIVKNGVGGHALLAVGADEAENRILVYDCNRPGELQSVTLSDNGTAWSYDMGGYGVWGGGDCSISYVPYDVLEDIWTRRGTLRQDTQVLTVNAENLSITNFDGETVASLENGRLVSSAEGVYELVDLSMYWPEERSICLPRNEVYTVSAADDITLNASMTDQHMSAEISTSAKTVTFGVNDDEKENSIVIEGASASDTYSISLESDFEDLRYKTMTMTGSGQGADVSVSLNQDGGLTFVNCNIGSLSVDGKSRLYGIGSATPDASGNLSVTLTNPAVATLAVAYFDGAGKFVSANLRGVGADVGTAVIPIPANAKTARVTLFDNVCRPLCEPCRATVG